MRIGGFGPEMGGKYFVDKTTRTIDRNGLPDQDKPAELMTRFYAWQVGWQHHTRKTASSTATKKYDSTYGRRNRQQVPPARRQQPAQVRQQERRTRRNTEKTARCITRAWQRTKKQHGERHLLPVRRNRL